MKQGFLSKLKEVSIEDFGHVLLFLIALPISWMFKRMRKDLWLVCEAKNEARDNAYWLFRYICENEPLQDVVYAINPKSSDYNKVSQIGKVVSYGTLKHWIYYLSASKNISTQKSGKPNAAICYLLEVYGLRKNVRIFLQHGVTINQVEYLFYKYSKINLFICAAEREYQYIKEYFGYPQEAIKLLGFCRFDNLHLQKVDKKLIMIMPTWRAWISPPSDAAKISQTRKVEFVHSEYFSQWQALLQDISLIKYLEENEYKIIFYAHREMQKFGKLFSSKSELIKIVSEKQYEVQNLLMDAALLITDYSSVSMDFAYMKKPQIYFQFDIERFRTEHYAKGYFDYKRDGFGPMCKTKESVIEQIKYYGMKSFVNDEIYHTRQEEFFRPYDNQNCRRNYLAIKEL